MKYRKLDADDDYSFGHGDADFLIDSSAAVAQYILTRLRLIEGEWFLDVTDGVPYATQVLGMGTKSLYDRAIQDAILSTPGVAGSGAISNYSSSQNPVTRKVTFKATVMTVFSTQPVTIQI